MDEPTAGLDPKERIRIRNLISKISFRKIVIIATHVVQDIEFISNEVMLLKKGTLIAKLPSELMIQSIQNKVFEIVIKEEEIDEVSDKWRISSMRKEKNVIITRILSDIVPVAYQYNQVPPSLEDLYLYLFDERDAIDPKVLEYLKGINDIEEA